jgi:hypothetical protein
VAVLILSGMSSTSGDRGKVPSAGTLAASARIGNDLSRLGSLESMNCDGSMRTGAGAPISEFNQLLILAIILNWFTSRLHSNHNYNNHRLCKT